jgi:addiction module HigA family antidote
MARLPTHRPPTHPGEMLLEEFIKPHGLTQSEVAQRLGVSFPRLNEIVNQRRGVTPDTAVRLAKLFGTTPDFWLGLQMDWDLWHALHGPSAEATRNITPLVPA